MKIEGKSFMGKWSDYKRAKTCQTEEAQESKCFLSKTDSAINLRKVKLNKDVT